MGIDRMRARPMVAAVAALAGWLAATAVPAYAEEGAGARLGSVISEALREGGSFFTAEERAVLERECGYAPGTWDGFDVRMSNGVLHCSNGRRVDHPEVRSIMAEAAPRIARRVSAVMKRPEVAAAIQQVADEARNEALRALSTADWDFDWD